VAELLEHDAIDRTDFQARFAPVQLSALMTPILGNFSVVLAWPSVMILLKAVFVLEGRREANYSRNPLLPAGTSV
jgi:hypothetical protein